MCALDFLLLLDNLGMITTSLLKRTNESAVFGDIFQYFLPGDSIAQSHLDGFFLPVKCTGF